MITAIDNIPISNGTMANIGNSGTADVAFGDDWGNISVVGLGKDSGNDVVGGL